MIGCIAVYSGMAAETGFLDDLIFFDVRSGKSIEMGAVTPETVGGFELLYATPGTGDISEIAGHLLLRVKLRNNPRAEEQGIENPHDLVLSFLADTEAGKPDRVPQKPVVQADCRRRNWFNLVNDNQATGEDALASLWQSLRGLSGGFEIVMDRQTLSHALKSYTVEQDRNLLRYRLNLTEQMKAELLAHLFYVKDHYRPPYYFFSQNCGSVLVKVIGQGVGDEAIAHFDPIVSPPHTLVGNLLRSGLATPVTPAFYSYRKLGFIAQELFLASYDELRLAHPGLLWPYPHEFFDGDEFVRANAVVGLKNIQEEHPALGAAIYELAMLMQEADMVYVFKGLNCENYTTAATAEARTLQATILRGGGDVSAYSSRALPAYYGPQEQAVIDQGTPHTQHFTWSVGVGYYDVKGQESGLVGSLEGALLKQQMGATSSVAMQRGSAVELGGVAAVFDETGFREGRVTGLRLQKFRDTLDRVRAGWETTRGLGLGLTVLDYQYREIGSKTHGALAGAALLGNLISSPRHNDFLFVSLGSDVAYHGYDRHQNLALDIPCRMEALVTVGRLQWRSDAEVTLSTRDDNGHEFRVGSSLAFRLGEVRGAETKLRLSVDHQTVFAGDIVREEEGRLWGQLQVEINRW